jgi:hypothetical protein
MYPQSVKSYFAIHEVVVLSGFTKYMLDYLARDGIFAPSGSAKGGRGRRRCYTYEDVVLLRALRTICAGKGKIRHLKESLVRFRKEVGPITPGQRLETLLVVRGDKLCTCGGGEGPIELLTGQLTLSFVVDLSMVSEAVAKCVVIDAESRKVVRLTPAAARKAEEERQRTWASVKRQRTAA